MCFLTLVFLNTLGFWRQRFVYLFFLETVFFFFFVPFFFSRVFLFLIISREHHICMILGFVFFFFFFFFSRQLIYENTSITRIYINNRQILVRFFFCIYCQTYFCFLKLCVSLYLKTKFWTSFFSRDVVFLCFMAFFLFFFFGQFLSVFLTSLNFLRVFLFFFFLVVFLLLRLVVTIHYFKLDHLKWEKNKQDGLRQRWSWSRHQN